MATAFSLLCLIKHITAINSQSFIIGSEPKNWHNSKTFCLLFGTNLASVHSESDFYETRNLCREEPRRELLIGLNDIDNEGVWKWEDGGVNDYGFVNNSSTNPTSGIFPWVGNEPNDNGGNEDCVMLWFLADYEWNDGQCHDDFYPICNYPDTNADKYSLYYADNIYTDQGKIRGISSWGLWTNNIDSFYNAIGDFSWITDTDISATIGNGTNFDNCPAFILDGDDYINGYRVVYGSYIYGLYFYTKNNLTYNCTAKTINNIYIDSGVILYKNKYLSGFIFDNSLVMDGIQFFFTELTIDPTIYPTINPTIEPTKYPSNPTSTPSIVPTGLCSWLFALQLILRGTFILS